MGKDVDCSPCNGRLKDFWCDETEDTSILTKHGLITFGAISFSQDRCSNREQQWTIFINAKLGH